MDNIDRRILAIVQKNSRIALSDLAEKVALSSSACHRRIKMMEEQGLIEGYAARVNGPALGYTTEFFVEISLTTQRDEALDDFEKAIALVPEILEGYLMAGRADYLLRIATRDTGDYERIHRERLSRLPHVARMHSYLVLRKVRNWDGYPV